MKTISTLLTTAALFLLLMNDATAQTNTFPTTGSVGIGTLIPNASSLLEVNSITKGVLIPRMKKNQRDAIVTPALGLLIYQTNDTTGFYYYSGTAWTAISVASANLSLSNLEGVKINRSLVADSVNKRNLGSKAIPWLNGYFSGKLTLATTDTTARLNIGGNIKMVDGTQGAGKVLTSDATGLASWQTPVVVTPGWALTGNTGTSAATNFIGTTDDIPLIFRTANLERFRVSKLGNLGVGTATPLAKLDIAGNIKIVDGTQAAGKVLTSDANGLASWQTPVIPNTGWALDGNTGTAVTNYIGTSDSRSFRFRTNNTERMILDSVGNVGIGIAKPEAQLHIGDGGFIIGNTSQQHIRMSSNAFASFIYGGTNLGETRLILNGNGGLVGIGTPSPNANLQVAGTGIYDFVVGNPGFSGQQNIMIGNGVGYSAIQAKSQGVGFNILALNKDGGNVGIGTATPTHKLEVSDNTNRDATVIISNLTGNTSFNDGLFITAGNNVVVGTSYYVGFYRPDNTNIGSVAQATANSVGYYTTSDRRLKTNIHETKFGLADIKKIQVNDYNFIGSKTEQTGFIAQQLYTVFPEAVAAGTDDTKKRPWMVDYGRVTPLLVKGMQELSKLNDELTTTVSNQQSAISNLQEQINDLKAMMLSGNQQSQINSQQVTLSGFSLLEQNVPNPFTHSTSIGYTLPQKFTTAQIMITDKNGKTLKLITVSGSGKGKLNVDASTLASGAYQYSLLVDGKLIGTKTMEHLK